jgi:hypothetical protein
MAQSYSDYIYAQSKRNPCLSNLCEFIADGSARKTCRIVSLEFHTQNERPRRADLDLLQLEVIVNDGPSDCQGRIIIVEDLNKALIETLGSSLDIDLLFFASHIHGPGVDTASSTPSVAILPSKVTAQNFLSLQYQRSVDFGACSVVLRKMFRNSNIPRKVVLLPPVKDIYIGLEQQGCSILLPSTGSKPWLGKVGIK